MNYNPSQVGLNNGKIFGLPFEFNESEIVILPVPWELTASFGNGTSLAPSQILEASRQLDLYHLEKPDAWKRGVYMLEISDELLQLNKKLQAKANEIILLQEKGKTVKELSNDIEAINTACQYMQKWVFEQCKTLLQQDKKVILLGGDHSTPLGYLKALSVLHKNFGILQIDAHADLRVAYEGFTYSHASVMQNALQLENIEKLVSVGIRDICIDEIEFANKNNKVELFFDQKIQEKKFEGEFWKTQVAEIIQLLPEKVYISFDIDGLEPGSCPNTGTPVPGGLQYQEAIELIRQVSKSGREIIGADLCEVGNDPWDANVGARVLYEMACWI